MSNRTGQWTARPLTALLLGFACVAQIHPLAVAEQVAVRQSEGATHGFLALLTLDGKRLADGEISQVAEGDVVNSHLVFHFTDGSLYDEHASFTQRGKFRLRNDHIVEKGPSFKQPMESTVDATRGRVRVRYTDDDGAERAIDEAMTVPEDVANGLLFTLLRHIDPATPSTTVPEVATTPKPRIVSLIITPQGEDSFTSGGSHYKATHYVLKVKIGGIAGLVAPLIGKQPPDMHVWIKGGDVPAFVKFEGPIYNGGPVWRVQLADSAKFP
jgi:hypothetical protein